MSERRVGAGRGGGDDDGEQRHRRGGQTGRQPMAAGHRAAGRGGQDRAATAGPRYRCTGGRRGCRHQCGRVMAVSPRVTGVGKDLGHRAVEGRVAVGEHAAVGGHEPVAVAAWVEAMPTTGWLRAMRRSTRRKGRRRRRRCRRRRPPPSSRPRWGWRPCPPPARLSGDRPSSRRSGRHRRRTARRRPPPASSPARLGWPPCPPPAWLRTMAPVDP